MKAWLRFSTWRACSSEAAPRFRLMASLVIFRPNGDFAASFRANSKALSRSSSRGTTRDTKPSFAAFFTGPGQYQDPHPFILVQQVKGLFKFLNHGRIQGIDCGGPVQGEQADGIPGFILDCRKCHGSLYSIS